MKMSVSPKLIYKLNAISFKIPVGILRNSINSFEILYGKLRIHKYLSQPWKKKLKRQKQGVVLSDINTVIKS